MSVSLTWGTTPGERLLTYPCDRYVRDAQLDCYRGVTIEAAPHMVYRWLCQMRVAPYSYDLIDNRRRRSPGNLITGLDRLAVGQSMMYIFRVVDFEQGRQVTLKMRHGSDAARIFGEMALSYMIVPLGVSRCRLLVKLTCERRSGLVGWLMRLLLPWGDLVMMRKQLLNFKRLAEESE
ncbi:MAG: hypothetical protein M3014_13845 [Chloroflexota bacterium]|nr:hypothetical protein [Chloroflexota bacterium]